MKKAFCILFLFFYSQIIFSQEWEVYSNAGNEKILSVKEIVGNDSGRMYAIGLDNFFKFESGEWVPVQSNVHTPSSTHFAIKSLTVTPDGSIYGVSPKSIVKYSQSADSLEFFNRKDIKGDWDYPSLTGLEVDNQNNLWFTSLTPYLTKFNGTDFTDFDIQLENKIIILNHNKVDLLFEGDSILWIAGDNGILRFNTNSTPDNLKYQFFSLDSLNFTGIVVRLFKEPGGRIWAIGNDVELAYFDENNWNKFEIPEEFKSLYQIHGEMNGITRICTDSSGNLLFFWRLSEFFLRADKNFNFEKIYFPESEDLQPVNTLSAYIDISGNLWVGTISKGIYSLKLFSSNRNFKTEVLIPEIYIRKVSPNPNNGIFKVDLLIYPDRKNNFNIGLFDLFGNKLLDLTQYIHSNNDEINFNVDISEFNQGIYFLFAKKGNTSVIQKVFYLK